MPAAVALFLYYLFLLFVLVQQAYLLVKERFLDWQRILASALLLLIIIITYLKPTGLVDFDNTGGKELLVARTAGAGECITMLKLTADKKFVEQNKCFGNTEIRGKYEFKGDTIFFKDVDMGTFDNSYYQYAIIKASSKKGPGNGGNIIRYQNELDKEGQSLEIINNRLRP
jgi:hypothetical protein